MGPRHAQHNPSSWKCKLNAGYHLTPVRKAIRKWRAMDYRYHESSRKGYLGEMEKTSRKGLGAAESSGEGD